MKKEQLEFELRAARQRIAELEAGCLSEDEARFASVFRLSPAQMALTDTATGQYVEVNQAFLETLGFARSEVIGKTATELDLFVDAALRATLLKRMAEQGYLRNEHVLVRAKSGEMRHGIFSAENLRADGQKLLLTVMNDVTEKIQAEERWRFALEGAGDGIWDWNAQTDRVFFSSGWKSMLGYEEAEIGDSLTEWSSRIHPDDLVETLAKVEAHLAGKTPVYCSEHRVRCKDGSYKWILDCGEVIEWTETQKPLRVIGTHKDITERKQAEQALRQSEKQYHSLIEALDVSLCRWQPDTTLTYANEKYKMIFGLQGEAQGQKWLDFLPEETRSSTLAFYAEVAENPRTVT